MDHDHATIEDLEINPAMKITPMVKQNLVNVINEEFNRQKTIYDAQSDEAKERVLEKYKKEVGYDALLKAHDKATEALETATKKVSEAKKKLNLKGLTVEGVRYQPSHYGHKDADYLLMEKATKKIDNLLKIVNEQGPDNVRNKIVSRLWLSDTCGEAMVILRQVLGNGLIPSISVKEIKSLPLIKE